jgi:hypothetical protein
MAELMTARLAELVNALTRCWCGNPSPCVNQTQRGWLRFAFLRFAQWVGSSARRHKDDRGGDFSGPLVAKPNTQRIGLRALSAASIATLRSSKQRTLSVKKRIFCSLASALLAS